MTPVFAALRKSGISAFCEKMAIVVRPLPRGPPTGFFGLGNPLALPRSDMNVREFDSGSSLSR